MSADRSADRRPVPTTLSRRTVDVPGRRPKSIPEIIAVAGGEAKTEALRAVLRGQAVTSVVASVVTDSDVAAKLLA